LRVELTVEGPVKVKVRSWLSQDHFNLGCGRLRILFGFIGENMADFAGLRRGFSPLKRHLDVENTQEESLQRPINWGFLPLKRQLDVDNA